MVDHRFCALSHFSEHQHNFQRVSALIELKFDKRYSLSLDKFNDFKSKSFSRETSKDD